MTTAKAYWMSVAIMTVGIVAAIALGINAPAGSAVDSFAEIAFTSTFDRNTDVWTVASNGDHRTSLTSGHRFDGYFDSPRFSPDGSTMVFVSDLAGSPDVWTKNVDGSGWVEQLTSGADVDLDPDFSPDGALVAYASDRLDRIGIPREGDETSFDIWTMESDGSNPSPLTTADADERFPRWSPDGSELAFVSDASGTFELWITSAAGGEAVQVTSGASITSFGWNPDGTSIVFSSGEVGNRDLFIWDRSNGLITPFVTATGDDTSPTWTSDGDEVVFSSNRDGTYGLFLVSAAGGDGLVFIDGPGDERAPTFSDNLDDMAYVSNTNGADTVFVADEDGFVSSELTVPAEIEPAWSRDGTQLAYVSDVSGSLDVWVVDASSGISRALTSGPALDRAPSWAPDGTKIAFESDRSGNLDIWQVDAEGLQTMRITESVAADSRPDWSPVSESIVFQSNREGTFDLWTINQDGSNPSRLTDEPVADEAFPAWSPDGRYIAFSVSSDEGSFDMAVIEIESNEWTTVLGDDDFTEESPTWSPNGSMFAYTSDESAESVPTLWLTNANGSTPQSLASESHLGAVDSTPDWRPVIPIDESSGSATVGLVDPARGEWHLRNDDGEVVSFFYGNPGDTPVIGDWDCDGIDSPGMYRSSDGFVYLRNHNSTGVADSRFFLGNPGDVPLAGDFDGDGCDSVSVYRPSIGRVFIANTLGMNDGVFVADFDYFFGNPGDKPFAGDFDADGIDTVGLHRETTGFVFFRNSNTGGIADIDYFFGNSGDRLVAGDWIDDGFDTVAIFRPSDATMYLRFSNDQGTADEQFPFGESSWLPVAGRFGI